MLILRSRIIRPRWVRTRRSSSKRSWHIKWIWIDLFHSGSEWEQETRFDTTPREDTGEEQSLVCKQLWWWKLAFNGEMEFLWKLNIYQTFHWLSVFTDMNLNCIIWFLPIDMCHRICPPIYLFIYYWTHVTLIQRGIKQNNIGGEGDDSAIFIDW